MRLLALLLTSALSARPVWAAIAYSRFAHPKGDYLVEYPSEWKQSVGLEALTLRPPGGDGARVRVSLERYPLGKGSPETPEAFIAGLLANVGALDKLDSRRTVEVAGRKAERLALTETAPLKGAYGQKLPGPMREVYLVVPFSGKDYYVLRILGLGKAFEGALPEFERIAQRLKLNASEPPAQ